MRGSVSIHSAPVLLARWGNGQAIAIDVHNAMHGPNHHLRLTVNVLSHRHVTGRARLGRRRRGVKMNVSTHGADDALANRVGDVRRSRGGLGVDRLGSVVRWATFPGLAATFHGVLARSLAAISVRGNTSGEGP